MNGQTALGVVAGVVLLIVLSPLALVIGAISAAFNRERDPETFGTGMLYICRWAFYGVAVLSGVGVLVLALLIDAQMTLVLLLVVGGAIAYARDRRDPDVRRGGVL